METANKKLQVMKGGGSLTIESLPSETFIPEDFTEEQKMMMDMCHQFLETEINPLLDRIDKLEPGLMPSLMEKAGEMGLLGVSIPESYGGLGKDFMSAIIVAEGLGAGHSFSVGQSAHTCIGTLPILYFGTDAQKDKYIPNLASGVWKGAYGLTEPNSGSDALGAKSTAKLTEDGKHYILNGQKCWITNGGFADVYTVFAKIDGVHFTAFILERGMEGFTQGPEEHKMGIKGSSTVQLYFQDCKVPVENVLGEIGKGHVIAFNILNIGRLKLCAATLGGAKKCLEHTIQYAKTREQFKKPIAEFGAIQQKLAEMTIRNWVAEAGLYRASMWIQQKEEELLAAGKPVNEALLAAAEEYSIECAMIKVFGSELLDYVVDESLQVHGGNGFSDEYNVSRAYRDSRINRIYEGTNEINRLLTVDMVLKRAMKGRLDLMGPAMAVQKELMSIPEFGNSDDSVFAEERKAIQQFKKSILMVAGAAVQKLMMKLESEQEILMHIADMAIETFHAESGMLRAMKLVEQKGEANAAYELDIARTYLYDAADKINKSGKDAINAFASGDEQRMMLLGLKRFTKVAPFNTKDARRRIAAKL
jgi:alkylation response protein AidB-like acyl-CoA dehydrogenase